MNARRWEDLGDLSKSARLDGRERQRAQVRQDLPQNGGADPQHDDETLQGPVGVGCAVPDVGQNLRQHLLLDHVAGTLEEGRHELTGSGSHALVVITQRRLDSWEQGRKEVDNLPPGHVLQNGAEAVTHAPSRADTLVPQTLLHDGEDKLGDPLSKLPHQLAEAGGRSLLLVGAVLTEGINDKAHKRADDLVHRSGSIRDDNLPDVQGVRPDRVRTVRPEKI
mmetsp:Transcript_2913/g.10719  ORF Transcript_2913/g.10719 Transcript_2913/m.10719 type:complete len:222 (-) Transcript_2913:4947-5612(-)